MVRHSNQGQVLLEIIWTILFIFAFVTLVFASTEKVQHEIKKNHYPTKESFR